MSQPKPFSPHAELLTVALVLFQYHRVTMRNTRRDYDRTAVQNMWDIFVGTHLVQPLGGLMGLVTDI
jgi:hypothetical protein